MAFSITFSREKNELLKASRGISFYDVAQLISDNNLLADKKHAVRGRSHQRMYIVEINRYAYVVPYVINEQTGEVFLKTIYPSRKYTKQYLKKGVDDD